MSGKIRKIMVVCCFLLFLPVMAMGEDKALDITLYHYGKYAYSWKQVTCINHFLLRGDENCWKDCGINQTAMEDYFRLQLKNNLVSIPYIHIGKLSDIENKIQKQAKLLTDETMGRLHPELKKGTLKYIETKLSIKKMNVKDWQKNTI